MTAPVDLNNLRSMTDGDPALEKELFEEFYASFARGLHHLETNLTNPGGEAWRKEAHALKGIALNLGAERLGGLCKEAQEGSAAGEPDKKTLLAAIEREYRAVRRFLECPER